MKTLLAFGLLVIVSGFLPVFDNDDTLFSDSVFYIAIDPGHGGEDEGMSFNGAVEKEITLAIANHLLKTKLNRTSVVLLRGTVAYLSVEDRIKHSKHYDLYISIHTGYSEALKSGPSVFYSNTGILQESSKGYGDFFVGYLTSTNEKAREAESELYVLDRLKCPAIHIEAGNMGTIGDFYDLTSEEGQKLIAQKIAKAINALADLKHQNEFAIKTESLKPKTDDIFRKNVQKATGN